jgi:hypothetical protein
VDFFLYACRVMAVQVANQALTCHISAGVAAGEGNHHSGDVNFVGKLLQ